MGAPTPRGLGPHGGPARVRYAYSKSRIARGPREPADWRLAGADSRMPSLATARHRAILSGRPFVELNYVCRAAGRLG
jgi:hypothetical protein